MKNKNTVIQSRSERLEQVFKNLRYGKMHCSDQWLSKPDNDYIEITIKGSIFRRSEVDGRERV